MSKVMIIGAGNVGRAAAYSMIVRGSCNEVILADIDRVTTEAHVLDMSDASYVLGSGATKVSRRASRDCQDVDIAVLTVGAKGIEGSRDRAAELEGSANIIKSIVPKMIENGFKGIFLVATNPCDGMTYYTYQLSGFDKTRVLGTGTSLDTARLHNLMQQSGMNPRQEKMLGEHGDAQFLAGDAELAENQEFVHRVRKRAYEIKPFKGCTDYGIGAAICSICENILDDSNVIIPVSAVIDDYAIGHPCKITRQGAFPVELKLTNKETAHYDAAVGVIRGYIKKLNG